MPKTKKPAGRFIRRAAFWILHYLLRRRLASSVAMTLNASLSAVPVDVAKKFSGELAQLRSKFKVVELLTWKAIV